MPCFIALATMDLHLSRFQVHEIVCAGLFFCNHIVTLSSIFSLCLPLILFLSLFPIVILRFQFFSSHYVHKEHCLSLPFLSSDLVAPAHSSTSSFPVLSTYEILSNLRRNHISDPIHTISDSSRTTFLTQSDIKILHCSHYFATLHSRH